MSEPCFIYLVPDLVLCQISLLLSWADLHRFAACSARIRDRVEAVNVTFRADRQLREQLHINLAIRRMNDPPQEDPLLKYRRFVEKQYTYFDFRRTFFSSHRAYFRDEAIRYGGPFDAWCAAIVAILAGGAAAAEFPSGWIGLYRQFGFVNDDESRSAKVVSIPTPCGDVVFGLKSETYGRTLEGGVYEGKLQLSAAVNGCDPVVVHRWNKESRDSTPYQRNYLNALSAVIGVPENILEGWLQVAFESEEAWRVTSAYKSHELDSEEDGASSAKDQTYLSAELKVLQDSTAASEALLHRIELLRHADRHHTYDPWTPVLRIMHNARSHRRLEKRFPTVYFKACSEYDVLPVLDDQPGFGLAWAADHIRFNECVPSDIFYEAPRHHCPPVHLRFYVRGPVSGNAGHAARLAFVFSALACANSYDCQLSISTLEASDSDSTCLLAYAVHGFSGFEWCKPFHYLSRREMRMWLSTGSHNGKGPDRVWKTLGTEERWNAVWERLDSERVWDDAKRKQFLAMLLAVTMSFVPPFDDDPDPDWAYTEDADAQFDDDPDPDWADAEDADAQSSEYWSDEEEDETAEVTKCLGNFHEGYMHLSESESDQLEPNDENKMRAVANWLADYSGARRTLVSSRDAFLQSGRDLDPDDNSEIMGN
ncbi:uncharacterized protein EV422DRAFT_572602 [Fimicolochytrium jonesii]|uniref:uncharacterized protein n=1 Tax=Fimicolochytrium jonesii TaxID=1396493 RepID=UPI0022FE6F4A|nr:uncharacterized protein EV422DRAFT_572602 [Fimicolochytrium jonesii]KAI8815612.1 hypothetical protein EV422DRAFT_572602 [Fimicolochytrium jonesii]